jgi:7-carboxy-7-deazaguanine synthase
MTATFPIAPNGIFWSLQGEGHLRGFQMAFLRLAGCSVGCALCDTDYTVRERLTGPDIVARLREVCPPGDRDAWVWVTGGEPADHDLRGLTSILKGAGFSVAVASSGSARVIPPVDWLSISPHSADPGHFLQRYGNEVKLIDGLHGLDLDRWLAEWPDERTDFLYRYVQPLSVDGREDQASLARCLAFLRRHPRWALSRQDHVYWGQP